MLAVLMKGKKVANVDNFSSHIGSFDEVGGRLLLLIILVLTLVVLMKWVLMLIIFVLMLAVLMGGVANVDNFSFYVGSFNGGGEKVADVDNFTSHVGSFDEGGKRLLMLIILVYSLTKYFNRT